MIPKILEVKLAQNEDIRSRIEDHVYAIQELKTQYIRVCDFCDGEGRCKLLLDFDCEHNGYYDFKLKAGEEHSLSNTVTITGNNVTDLEAVIAEIKQCVINKVSK